jgi:hypothetical protein
MLNDKLDLNELHGFIHQLLGGATAKAQLITKEKLQRSYVYRLTWEINGAIRSLVVKRFSLERSFVEQQAIKKWLVAVNLAHFAPSILGVAPEKAGQFIWHVYEDLGDCALEQDETAYSSSIPKDRGFLSPLRISPDRDHIEVIIRLIAVLHEKFLGHILLGECRQQGSDLGSHFLHANVHDAICALESLPTLKIAFSKTQIDVRDSILEKLGGAPTLLHGDLSVKNAFVFQTKQGLSGKLIDWDHVGVGPVSYDLSTLLMQFPIKDRIWILNHYQHARGNKNSPWPTCEEWNVLFETNEYARLANSVIWAAVAATEDQPVWAFEKLDNIGYWFEKLNPVLPITDGINISGSC